MKIAIDISQIAYPGTGVSRYTKNLVDNLLEIDRVNEYVLFAASLRSRRLISELSNEWAKKKNVTLRIFPYPPLLLESLWNRFHLCPIESMIGNIDIFHSSDWLQPPSRAKKVTTIHDGAIYRFPGSFKVKGGHDIVKNQKRRMRWVREECDLVMVDSEATRTDAIKYMGINNNKLRVVYLAAENRFRSAKEEVIKSVLKKYSITNPYAVCVGTIEPRKNLKGVIKALDYINQPLTLVVAGKFGWGEGIFPRDQRIKILGYVSDDDLVALYSGADCFVYPSFYEGFGIPILEAMKCGCPVVTSKRGSLPEIAGEAAIYVDPKKPADIASGIKDALRRKRELSLKGFKQSAKFNWEKTAKEVLSVYRSLVG